jgi:replicative DNA helicase
VLFNEQVEAHVIGTMISYEGFSDDVFMNLEEEDFYFEWARAIYRTAKPLHDENKLHIGALMTRMELNTSLALSFFRQNGK